MTRTYKSTGHWEYDEDDGTTYYQRPHYCTKKHSRNVSKWVFYNDLWPMDVRDCHLKIPRTNRNTKAFYERRHHMCTKWEINKMAERLDGQAMDKEWKRMQDEIMAENADVKCKCGWAGDVNDLEVGFVIEDTTYGRMVCHCPECGSYNDYEILG